ncbi:MAG: hypothetical protein D3910_00630 [Candidatus Electrothrix sp. ATG2]|nr:hypothetical protein [Candidatus Electrothrix sp. ATG2]
MLYRKCSKCCVRIISLFCLLLAWSQFDIETAHTAELDNSQVNNLSRQLEDATKEVQSVEQELYRTADKIETKNKDLVDARKELAQATVSLQALDKERGKRIENNTELTAIRDAISSIQAELKSMVKNGDAEEIIKKKQQQLNEQRTAFAQKRKALAPEQEEKIQQIGRQQRHLRQLIKWYVPHVLANDPEIAPLLSRLEQVKAKRDQVESQLLLLSRFLACNFAE